MINHKNQKTKAEDLDEKIGGDPHKGWIDKVVVGDTDPGNEADVGDHGDGGEEA